MSQTCVFVNPNGEIFIQQSLTSDKMFAIVKGYIPNARLLFCYMGWRLYGTFDENEQDGSPNDVATLSLRKICKTSTTLHGAVAFCFRSTSEKAFELIQK